MQGRPGALGQVVAVLKAVYGLDHVYVWHGLSAYWSGLSHEEPGVAQYEPRLVFCDPTPGLREVSAHLCSPGHGILCKEGCMVLRASRV